MAIDAKKRNPSDWLIEASKLMMSLELFSEMFRCDEMSALGG
jgi:hypothetical protein